MKTYIKYLLVSFVVLLTFTGFSPVNSDEDHRVKPFVVMIDPGHGGRDTGTPGTGRYKTTEKDIALDVSLTLGKMIESGLPNVKVMYTRTVDNFPTLESRPIAANKADADLFISIHCNAQPGKKGTADGSETFVLGLSKEASNLELAKRENSVIFLEDNYEERYEGFDPNTPESLIGLVLMQEDYLDQSIQLARYIEDEFQITAKRKSRGVKQAGFWVLSQTYMPSVLVELGFLTHKKEEDFLNSKNGKKIMSQALFNAVKKYIEEQTNIEGLQVTNNGESSSNDSKVIDHVIFKVQIAASSRDLETEPYNFKGLNSISKLKVGETYRYFYGETSSYDEILNMKNEAVAKGYESCFIVAYKNGEKIPLDKAFKN